MDQHKNQVSHPNININNATQPMITNDSPDLQYVGVNSSHSQIRIPEFNMFARPGQNPNQVPSFSSSFQTTTPVQVQNFSYPSHSQQLGTQFSFQGLLNSPNSPDSPILTSSKTTKKNGKPAKNQDTQATTRRNWSIAEDIALTKAWLNVSVDSVVGKDQTSEKMWNRIFLKWREFMGKYDETRNKNGLSCRWGMISAAVSKFQAKYKTMEREPRSGSDLDFVKTGAMRAYSEETGGQTFKFEHCWEIMKHNPKWCSSQLTKVGGSNKQKVAVDTVHTIHISTPASEPSSANGGNNSDSSDKIIENSNISEIVRPLRRKGSKHQNKNDETKTVISVISNLQSSLDTQIELAKEKLALKKAKDDRDYALRKEAIEMQMKFKKDVQKRKEDERIMNLDLTKLQPAYRVVIEKRRAKIFKDMENEGLFGDVSTSEEASI